MNELDKKYSDFLSTLSHELRTPLTSIRGFADTLLSSGDKLTEEQKQKFLEIIKEQSGRLIKMVENLLAVSKLETQKDLVILKNTNVVPILEQAIQVVKAQYPKHFYKFEFPQSLHYLPEIYVDGDKFQQIMVNLIENGSKYSPEGSTIKIKAQVKNQFLSLKIIDEGVGINEKDYEKIFEKFSRIDSPLTRKTQGSGLGLYITKSLTELMNGTISVSSLEKGSCFEVEFPLMSAELQMKEKLKERKNAD